MERTVIRRGSRAAFILLFACALFFALTLYVSAAGAEHAPVIASYSAEVTYGDSFFVELTGAEAGAEVVFEMGELSAAVLADEEGRAAWRLPSLTLAAQRIYTCKASLGETVVSCEVAVTPRPLTVEGFAVQDRPYNGGRGAEISSFGTLVGLLPEDVSRVALDTSAVSCVFSRSDVGTGIRVSVIGFNLSGSAKNNYTVSDPDNVTASITRRALTLEGAIALPFTYNGIAGQSVELCEGYRLLGIVPGEEDAVWLNGVRATVASPAASVAQGVVFDPAVTFLRGELANNYELILPTDVTVEIRPAALTLSVEKVTVNKGQPIPALTAKVDGFVNGESAEALEGFLLPTVVPGAVNTLNAALTSFTVAYVGGNATANYVFDVDSFTAVTLEIRRVEATLGDYTVSVEDLSKWYNTAITVTPAGAYTGITTDNTDGSVAVGEIDFLSLLTLNGEGECRVRFALCHTDGTVTEEIELSYKLDTVAPTGDVLWRGQSVIAAGASAFRYFSRESIRLSFTAFDGEGFGGVVQTEYALTENGPFVPVSDEAVEVATAAGVYRIWYRITDGAGNVTLLCTDGMVLYRDAELGAAVLTYQRLSGQNAVTLPFWNENTLAALRKADGEPLMAEDFSVGEDGTLCLHASYLSTLAAGEHHFLLTLCPMGQPYVALEVNDAPAELMLTLNVTRRAPTVADFTVKLPTDLIYNGGEKQATVTAPAGMGSITVYYEDQSQNRLSVIKNAGTYTVKIDVGIGYDYEGITALTVGVLTVEKMTPQAPTVAYDAVTGLVSGEVAGLLYSLDGVLFLPVPQSLSGIVTDVCSLYFYLPGDGINTENSKMTVLEITRAQSPIVVPVDETLFAACDGKLYAIVEGLEYRHVGETQWRAVEGTAVNGLAPGTYEVRVAALGTVLESSAVRVVIQAAPEFVSAEQVVAGNGQPTVTLRGELTVPAALVLEGLSTDPDASSALRSLSVIDTRTTEVIGFFELKLIGRHRGAVTLDIAVGDAYNGRVLTVYRELSDGSTEMQAVPCENGVITLTAEELSAILITTPMTTPYGIGSGAWVWVLSAMLALVILVCIVIDVRTRKQKKRER